MDSIIWAFRRTVWNIAETGLVLLLEILKKFQASEFRNQFYQSYFLRIEEEMFVVLTDTFHKPGFNLQVLVLPHLFSLVGSDTLTEPLWDISTVYYQYSNNEMFVREYTNKLLQKMLPNMTEAEVARFVRRLLESKSELSKFKHHMRDFLLLSKELQLGYTLTAHDCCLLFFPSLTQRTFSILKSTELGNSLRTKILQQRMLSALKSSSGMLKPNLKHVVQEAGESRLDLALTGYKDIVEFALITCPSEPLELSGGKDEIAVLWNIQDHRYASASNGSKAFCSTGSIIKLADGSPVWPHGFFRGVIILLKMCSVAHQGNRPMLKGTPDKVFAKKLSSAAEIKKVDEGSSDGKVKKWMLLFLVESLRMVSTESSSNKTSSESDDEGLSSEEEKPSKAPQKKEEIMAIEKHYEVPFKEQMEISKCTTKINLGIGDFVRFILGIKVFSNAIIDEDGNMGMAAVLNTLYNFKETDGCKVDIQWVPSKVNAAADYASRLAARSMRDVAGVQERLEKIKNEVYLIIPSSW
ncbi:OLC1v1037650C1 [Oldenlandia corymbosa var. corymbosa]|nr:OLC1v1037650C1 [Oldenlandia corymbosa var. corymbosa]